MGCHPVPNAEDTAGFLLLTTLHADFIWNILPASGNTENKYQNNNNNTKRVKVINKGLDPVFFTALS